MKSIFRVITLLIVSGFVFWSACSRGKQVKDSDSGNSPVPAALDSDFQLTYNQTATLETENLTVKFIDVAEDSRCPVGVECIWPGQAKIDLEIKRQSDKPENIQLTSLAGEPGLAQKSIGDYNIRLVKVDPPRTTDRELKLSDYKITLKISRNTENRQKSSQ
jgi:hypothetical protein